jgi:hypothetical protein
MTEGGVLERNTRAAGAQRGGGRVERNDAGWWMRAVRGRVERGAARALAGRAGLSSLT